MSVEPQNASNNLGSLQSCLVEGDPTQRKRERSVRRRALIVSVFLQGAILAALVLIPLFGKPERIVMATLMPLPPYHRASSPSGATPQTPTQRHRVCVTCITRRPVDLTAAPKGEQTQIVDPLGETGTGAPTGPCPGCIPLGNLEGSRPPLPTETASTKPRMIHKTQIDPAMLIHRVEPVFPPLAKQTHRGGRVELRAIIATDGTIQSLQVVSGDPLFYQSAMNAVQQWRYRPTILNGQPVEIDTFISVIYIVQ
jgi:periplasmic protein TonB